MDLPCMLCYRYGFAHGTWLWHQRNGNNVCPLSMGSANSNGLSVKILGRKQKNDIFIDFITYYNISRNMERSTHHRIHVFLIVLLGLCIFGAMNGLMLMHNPETWTSQRLGAWTAFHKDFVFSGFDQFTYIVVSKWRPLFELYRHPMLAIMLWPLTWVNSMLSDYFHMNCAIYVVAVTYTLVSTATWCLL